MMFSSFVGVDLSGTQSLGTMPIAVSYGMQSGSSEENLGSATVFNNALLNPSVHCTMFVALGET